MRCARDLDGWGRGRPDSILCVFVKLIVIGCMFGLVPPGSLRSWEVLVERMLSGLWHLPQDVINRVLCCATSPNRSLSNIYLGTTAGGGSGPGWRRGKVWPSCSFGVSGGTPGSYPHPCSAIGIMGMGFNGCSGMYTHFWYRCRVQEPRPRYPTHDAADSRSS